jgi:hypothetical protein
MFTLWREGKIVFGEVQKGVDWRSYPELDCSAIWITHTKYARPFDFHRTVDSIHPSGAPIHTVSNGFGGFSVDVEAFCNTERKATCFIKITVKNNAPYTAKDKLGIVVRSGKEKLLVHGSPDEYVSYMPEISEFKHHPTSFAYENGVLFDMSVNKGVFITAETSLPLSFDKDAGIWWAELELDARESREIILSFGKGEPAAKIDYESEKANTLEFWKKELSRITNIPEKLDKNSERGRALIHGTTQLLQCFSYYVGTDELVLRQGGLQRLIWPWEAMPWARICRDR